MMEDGATRDVQALLAEVRKLRAELQHLKDRQDIHDTIARYCRAMDRHDWDLLCNEVYHSDGIADQGAIVGTARQIAADSGARYERDFLTHSHVIANHLCEISGDTAHAETYVITYLLTKDGQSIQSTHARYIDRLEKREGHWKIALRRIVREARSTISTLGDAQPAGTWDRTDISYERPLSLPPDRAALIKR